MLNHSRKLLIGLLTALILGAFLVIAVVSYSNTITPEGIVIHHSAIPHQDGVTINAELIEEIHKQRGFQLFYWGKIYYIGYHYVILPDGTIETGRPEKSRGAHTQSYNQYIGICLIGDFSSNEANKAIDSQKPSAEQMKSLTKLIENLRSKYSLPVSNINLHNQLNLETKCPGENFPIESFYNSILGETHTL